MRKIGGAAHPYYDGTSAAAFITGTKPMGDFDSYITGLDALKLSEVQTVRQNQIYTIKYSET